MCTSSVWHLSVFHHSFSPRGSSLVLLRLLQTWCLMLKCELWRHMCRFSLRSLLVPQRHHPKWRTCHCAGGLRVIWCEAPCVPGAQRWLTLKMEGVDADGSRWEWKLVGVNSSGSWQKEVCGFLSVRLDFSIPDHQFKFGPYCMRVHPSVSSSRTSSSSPWKEP